MAEGSLIFKRLSEYAGRDGKVKGKDIGVCMHAALSQCEKKTPDKMLVSQIADNASAEAFGKGMSFTITDKDCIKFQEAFCRKRLQQANDKLKPKKETTQADVDEAVKNLQTGLEKCSKVGPKGTAISKTGGVAKMTDASQYTGAHKSRFDGEGKGKGLEGREDKVENTGYVGNYKEAGTFDKKK